MNFEERALNAVNEISSGKKRYIHDDGLYWEMKELFCVRYGETVVTFEQRLFLLAWYLMVLEEGEDAIFGGQERGNRRDLDTRRGAYGLLRDPEAKKGGVGTKALRESPRVGRRAGSEVKVASASSRKGKAH